MNKFYSSEKNTLMLVALLKEHGIRKVIASPGMKNMNFVASVQNDDFFEIYSCVDERSAAYMACGLAAQTGEPVVLSCTGATASRNYIPGLTEAYYRKLPILAVTSTTHIGEIGHLIPQNIDRRSQLNDIVNMSVQIPTIHCAEDSWSNNILINSALLELKHHGGGPVHINLFTTNSTDFSVKNLPRQRAIHRFSYNDEMPKIPQGKIAVFVGAHTEWDEELTTAVNSFCEKYNAVVLGDHTSNYNGPYAIYPSIVCCQRQYKSKLLKIDLLIHIGEISGTYMKFSVKSVWRVSPDGQIRDTFKKLNNVFEMNEKDFFMYYNKNEEGRQETNYYEEWKNECNKIRVKQCELPFSNAWIAEKTLPVIPKGAFLHLGILNTLRTWSYFDGRDDLICFSNTGGFGIDGVASTLIGASFANPNKLFFGVLGDLAFFYDLNSIGNRHINNNVRIMVVNNGRGTEFRNYAHPSASFGDKADMYMAAAGHFGNQSKDLLKNYSQNLGFDYLCASSKEEYLEMLEVFTTDEMLEKPIVFEVFTNSSDESDAIKIMRNIEIETKEAIIRGVKNMLGDKGTTMVKNFVSVTNK